jgi:hypothetical protein
MMRLVQRNWRPALAAGLVLFQVVMIVHARFDPRRYFCWAPHDAQNEYGIEVRVGGRVLSREETWARYRDPLQGLDPRSIEHVLLMVRQHERTYGKNDGALVRVTYRTNGGPWREWNWPEP